MLTERLSGRAHVEVSIVEIHRPSCRTVHCGQELRVARDQILRALVRVPEFEQTGAGPPPPQAMAPSLARKIPAAATMVWHYERGSILSAGQAASHPELELVLRKHRGPPPAVEEVAEGSVQPRAVLAFVHALAATPVIVARNWSCSDGAGPRRRRMSRFQTSASDAGAPETWRAGVNCQ